MRILFQMSWMKRLLLRWYEHPLLQSSTSKIHQDTQSPLWSGRNEIYRSGIWGWNQWARRERRSTQWMSIRVWIRDVETRSWSQEGSEREGMVGERDSRGFSDLISQEWKLRCRIGIQVRVMKSCHQCSFQQDTLFRVRIQENKNWVFICQDCLKIVKSDNPHYQYGGTWKNRKKK